MRKNPLKRALRLDKVTLSALAAVLRLYLDPDRLAARLPTLRLLARPQQEVQRMAERLLLPLKTIFDNIEVIDCESQIGSGALPTQRLPSAGLAIRPGDARLAARFRKLPVPVIGRLQDGAFVLDLRCLENEAEFLKNLGSL
jgi:L-seryl-tRNA(Ser) seleniumtransferase